MTTPSEETNHDYRSTLNLPLSDKDANAFPQRGSLPTREPIWQQRWAEMDLYRRSLGRESSIGTWILHDGPPYSNGNIHLGHALNKTAKDIAIRYHSMLGYDSPYVPGFDNHGMPIENAVAREFREAKRSPERVDLRKACREYAAKWVAVQSEQFKRLGIRGDWDHPYLTMSSLLEARIVEVFGELASRGFIYRGLKPVLWCGVCETALADAEVEYEQHTSNSIYVRFPLHLDEKGIFTGAVPAYAVIWTTTPWTIPANLALAVHPDADYQVVRCLHNGEEADYLLAAPLRESVMAAAQLTEIQVMSTVRGADLQGTVFSHPLFHRTSPVLPAAYVTMDAGTGIVHTAPGHGKEDFDTGIRFGLEVLNPVAPDGRYTAQAGSYEGTQFEGLRVIPDPEKPNRDSAANSVMLKALRASGHLLAAEKFEHSYPHCWRCHSPLIFRATIQWFMNIDHDGFREKALSAIQSVTWHPKEAINRISSMVSSRPDWCISRQRSWGVGIPAFYCQACGEAVVTPESVAAVAALTRRETGDAWYVKTPSEILPQGFCCPHCSASVDQLRKETDVLDVWFDSGSTNRAVLEGEEWPELHWPADVYLEGGDQHRGWFNSSLMIAVATRGAAPYKNVVTNGWTLDENGEAMHKSKGNTVDPLAVINQYGADVVRWWVASQDFMAETKCGNNLLKQVGDMYRRVRNTFRFMVNNLADFNVQTDSVPGDSLLEMDAWALQRLNQLVADCRTAYDNYHFHHVYQAVLNFCSVDLSSFYLDVLKDRLYASARTSQERRSAQTALWHVCNGMARLLAPILVHTAEEVWDHLNVPDSPGSVHLTLMPVVTPPDEPLLERWQKLRELRDCCNRALEEARKAGEAGNPLESCLVIRPDEAMLPIVDQYAAALDSILLVSQVILQPAGSQLEVTVKPAEGRRCERCWLVRRDVGSRSSHPSLCGRCADALE